jgi:AraC-like DNA-binding protein
MGLTEAVAPIMVSEMIVGFIMLGQVRRDDLTLEQLLEKTMPLGLSTQSVAEAFQSLSVESAAKISAASHILDACASYLYLAKQVEIIGDDTASEINDFIDLHLGDALNVDMLCGEFLLTRVQIYDLFHRHYAMTVAEYVRKKRMEKAAMLLKTTDMLVKEVAQAINQDYNYFPKEFVKYFGVTPKIFQTRAHSGKEN